MAEQNRSTVVAVVPESTEGTAVAPSGATDYISVQPDMDLSPNFDKLENNELRSSIGTAKPILGAESPSASFSHYLRHSGTEGSAPNFNDLLKAAFGAETVNSTQRTTTSGSTTSVIALGAGGSDFARGKAVLIKDGTNGYSIRPVHSVSSNNLTLGFNVASAPATGIGVGKCINYAPANTGHQTLSLWVYRGNRSAVELLRGCRVTGISVDFSAGQLINANYSLEGIGYAYNPIILAATDIKLDFLDDATTRVATLTAGLYKDPHDLASAISAAMNGLGSSNTFTVSYSDTTGKFTIASSGTTLTLKWNTGANAVNTIGDAIGFSTAADSSAALTYTSATAQTITSPYTPTLDDSDPLAAKYNEVLLGDTTDSVSLAASSVKFDFSESREPVKDVAAESGVSGSILSIREVSVQVTAYLTQYDISKFKKFRAGDTTRFAYVFGTRSGGNWVAGKCGCLYLPSAVIDSFKVAEENGILVLQLGVKAFVDSSGNGEVYLNFL